MAGRFQRPTARVYRYHHREESQALERLLLALAHWADLEEEAGHFQQGLEASALCHRRGESQALEVPPSALAQARVWRRRLATSGNDLRHWLSAAATKTRFWRFGQRRAARSRWRWWRRTGRFLRAHARRARFRF